MAKIFISHSNKDVDLISEYVNVLKDYGHEILFEDFLLKQGSGLSEAVLQSIEESDGVLVFLTQNGVKSTHVNAEISVAYRAYSKKEKFLIPLTYGIVKKPHVLNQVISIKIENEDIRKVVVVINEIINKYQSEKNQSPESSQSPFSSSFNASFGSTGNQTKNIINYWFLKIEETLFDVADLQKGFSAHISLNRFITQSNDQYKLFKKINADDRIIGYAYKIKAAVCIFEMREPNYEDATLGETFSIVAEELLRPPIELTLFADKIPLEQLDDESIRVISITEETFNAIIKSTVEETKPSELYYNKSYLSEIFADNPSKDIKDKLDFKSDVEAIAKVIAYKEVKPPLAVGLFGNWGSGKSFFMNKLQQRIEDLKTDTSGLFCNKILSVNFNSWHYSDSNLWASLVTKIFEDINKYGNQAEQKKEGDVKKLFENLNSTKELLEESKEKKKKIDAEINSLTQQKEVFDKTVTEKSEKLESLSLKEILQGIIENDSIKKDIADLKNEYSFLDIKEYDDIDENLRKLTDFSGKSAETVKLFWSFLKGKKLIAFLSYILIAVGIFALINNSDFVKNHLENYKAIFGITSGLLIQFLAFFKPAMNMVDVALKRLRSLKTTVDKLKIQAKSKFDNQKQALEDKLKQAQEKSDEAQQEIELLKIEQNKIQTEIDDIVSGRKIIRFVEGRVADQRYINSLGIISWIRKDFEELDFLLKQQYDAKELAKSGREKIENLFEIERIILYIDDLDRCGESLVVKVLEAIHLLLAFPLFVVIVGVDPRWMHNALNLKYLKLLAGNESKNKVSKQDHLANKTPATSYDYLEKIFQIPFALKPINKDGKDKLIKSQFEKEEESKDAEDSGKKKSSKNEEEENKDAGNSDKGKSSANKQEENKDAGNSDKGKSSANNQEENKDAGNSDDTSRNNIQLETLIISEEEIKFMQAISFLIGNSPRTIKRYINMYRIIRTHKNFKFVDDNELEHYYAAMVLLGIITGLPESSQHYYKAIKAFDSSKKFIDFLDKHIGLLDEKDKKRQGFELIRNSIITDETTKPLGDILIEKFNANIALISRFSFRDLNN